MSWDRVSGRWKELQGAAKAKWGDLTDDELTEAEGNKDRMLGLLQKKYAMAKDEAERELDDLVSKL